MNRKERKNQSRLDRLKHRKEVKRKAYIEKVLSVSPDIIVDKEAYDKIMQQFNKVKT